MFLLEVPPGRLPILALASGGESDVDGPVPHGADVQSRHVQLSVLSSEEGKLAERFRIVPGMEESAAADVNVCPVNRNLSLLESI